VHGLIASSPSGDWSYGAAILTFAFPMILFIVVAAALYILYTTPHMVPGHRYRIEARAVTDTPAVAMGGPAGQQTAPGGQAGGPAAAGNTEG
jgi:hypothetical protein